MQGAAIAGAGDFQALPGRRIHRQGAAHPHRLRALQMRQLADLRRPHIVERTTGGDGFQIGKTAKGCNVGDRERVGQQPACRRRGTCRALGPATRGEFSQIETFWRQDFRRIEPP